MKKRIILPTIFILVIFGVGITENFINDYSSEHNMGKYKEIAQLVVGVTRSTFSPVYLINDLPEGLDPEKRVVLKNGAHKKSINGNLTILSWNILRNYNKQDIKESLAKIFDEESPDIIFIQEAPVYQNSSFWGDELFSKFNVFYAPLHQIQKQDEFYNFVHSGQLILSKYPFTKTEVYPLPSVSRQFLGKNHFIKRLATYAQIKGKKSIGLYNVHLENSAWQTGRKKQIDYLLEIINENNDDIVIIGGDFNTFLGKWEQGLNILRELGFRGLFGTGIRLDHFFVKNALAIGKQLKGEGSDHQPIMAIVKG